MKLRLLLVFFGLMIFSLTNGQNPKITYHFNNPVFVEKYDGYSEIQMEGCLSFSDEGTPLLPRFGAEILLPQGKKAVEVRIISVQYSDAIEQVNVVPASRQFPISLPAPPDYKPVPDASIYSSDKPYPSQLISDLSTQYLSGYSIAVFSITPVEIIPSQHSIRYITEIEIEVITENNRETIAQPAGFSKLAFERVSKIVDNPEMADNYSFGQLRDGDEVDLLLITKQQFVPNFQQYVTYKLKRGFITEIITTETIYSTYTGNDDQAKIRNCIKDFYENHGLEYVILGGDADPNNSTNRIVPHRGFVVITGFGTDDNDIPSDMYYACLDGTWNNNGNNLYGEPGEEDLYAEVMVGRLCIDAAGEITNVTNKLIKYQDTPVVADIENALMVGEQLDDATFGCSYKMEVASGSSNFGYTTAGIPANFQVNTLYEINGGWSKYDIYDEFNNQGCNLLNHLGHSSTTYNMKMETSDLTTSNFQNNGTTRGFVVGYSQGCYNGAFDNRESYGGYVSDCFSEVFTTMATGEVATIGNSRYGWYSQGNTNGASQYLDRQFYDAIFGENITQIGAVNSDSKEDNVSYILGNKVIRWCAYETTLFGDPTMDIWTAQPTSIVATHPNSLPIGISEMTVETDAPYARIGLFQNGQLIGRTIANETGDATVEFFNYLSSGEPIELSITAHNRSLYTSNITVVTNQPYIVIDYTVITDENGNNNGIPEYGEELSIGLALKNLGTVAAQNVIVTLVSTDQYVTLSYLAVEFGDFAPGETIFIENAFPAIVAENIPDQHLISISMNAMGQQTWISDFEILVNAPDIQVTEIIVNDCQGGNGNGKLDPGENVIFEVYLSNQGHAITPDIYMFLGSVNPHVNILTDDATHGPLQPTETCWLGFEASVSPDANLGDLAEIVAYVVSGAYEINKGFIFEIGNITEDFETGDFSLFEWEFVGNAPWQISNGSPYQGSFCIKSGNISDNQSSEIKMTLEIAAPDTISFYRKVSSEAGCDYLKFYVDDVLKDQWAGTLGWLKISIPVDQGLHTYRWVFKKDLYISAGSDCAWLDFIEFPPLLPTPVGIENNFAEYRRLQIFPNPNRGSFTIENPDELNEFQVTVFNSTGQEIFNKDFTSPQKYVQIELNKPKAGIYFVSISNRNTMVLKKLVIE